MQSLEHRPESVGVESYGESWPREHNGQLCVGVIVQDRVGTGGEMWQEEWSSEFTRIPCVYDC